MELIKYLDEQKGMFESIENILDKLDKPHLRDLLDQINKDAFSNFCKKSYKEGCDVAYCVFARNESCQYLEFLNFFQQKYGINLLDMSVRI